MQYTHILLKAKKRHECVMERIFNMLLSTLAIRRAKIESRVVFNGRLSTSRKSNSVIFA